MNTDLGQFASIGQVIVKVTFEILSLKKIKNGKK